MSTTASRWLPKHPVAAPSGAASGPSLGQALTDTDAALIRIRCHADRNMRRWHDLTAFTAGYRRIWFHPTDRDADLAERAELIVLLFNAWPTVDWNHDHQLIVATGEIQAAPNAWELGWLPDEDRAFGPAEPAPAVYLPAGRTWADAPTPTYPLPVTTRSAA